MPYILTCKDSKNKEYKMGHCKKRSSFRGTVKVTDKGQITIPKHIQDELNIDRGDILLIVKRDDGKGFNILKENIVEEILNNKKYT